MNQIVPAKHEAYGRNSLRLLIVQRLAAKRRGRQTGLTPVCPFWDVSVRESLQGAIHSP